MAYFIEVTKISGVKTYFGKGMDEMYKPKTGLGWETQGMAESYLGVVTNRCKTMGMMITEVKVIEDE